MFWSKFTQKGYFQSKTEKVNNTIELCTFKLDSEFQLKLTTLIFGINIAQEGYLLSKT